MTNTPATLLQTVQSTLRELLRTDLQLATDSPLRPENTFDLRTHLGPVIQELQRTRGVLLAIIDDEERHSFALPERDMDGSAFSLDATEEDERNYRAYQEQLRASGRTLEDEIRDELDEEQEERRRARQSFQQEHGLSDEDMSLLEAEHADETLLRYAH